MEGDSYKLRGLREGERDAPRRDKEKGGREGEGKGTTGESEERCLSISP
jgi:hypothetical protein